MPAIKSVSASSSDDESPSTELKNAQTLQAVIDLEAKTKISNVLSTEDLTRLTKDLPGLNLETFNTLRQTLSLEQVAKVFGYDVSHYDNLQFAGRLLITLLNNRLGLNISKYVGALNQRLDTPVAEFFLTHQAALEIELRQCLKSGASDLDHDYFSASTLLNLYLAKPSFNEDLAEIPLMMCLRYAIFCYEDEGLEEVLYVFHKMAQHRFTPPSPALFNAGFKRPQCGSCFLMTVEDDLEHIYDNLKNVAMISKFNGGNGLDVSRIRHSEIGYSGRSSGVIPMLQVYNSSLRYVDQGGKRKGAGTFFLRPHHIDIYEFVSLVENTGDRYARAHDLNNAIWTSWVFWKRVRQDGDWTLFCPAKTKELNDVYGLEFERRYLQAEKRTDLSPLDRRTVKARKLLEHMVEVQRKKGMPYILSGDSANLKSNHRHLGYIRSSNLCLEIMEYTSKDEIASCNLSSVSLAGLAYKYITPDDISRFDSSGSSDPKRLDPFRPEAKMATEMDMILKAHVNYALLGEDIQLLVRNLNKTIDKNFYPLDKVSDQPNAKVIPGIINTTNKRHRPLGIGVSGFAELLHDLDLPMEHPLTYRLNKCLFACQYFNALCQSVQLAVWDGAYESFPGSPFSQGLLQFDLWAEEFKIKGPNPSRVASDDEPVAPETWGQSAYILYARRRVKGVIERKIVDTIKPTWDDLKRVIMKYGTRNSLLLAPMPTASSAQILRNCESMEAHLSNIYSRKVLKNSCPILVRGMVRDFTALKLWSAKLSVMIQADDGSIQKVPAYIESQLKVTMDSATKERLTYLCRKYKTMWEISQRNLLHMAADRGRYIDQSQSTNVYIRHPTNEQLCAMHLYTDELGLKTGMYYLRTESDIKTIQFTIDPELVKFIKDLPVTGSGHESKVKVGDKTSKDLTQGEGVVMIPTPGDKFIGTRPMAVSVNDPRVKRYVPDSAPDTCYSCQG